MLKKIKQFIKIFLKGYYSKYKKNSYSQCGEDLIVDFLFKFLGILHPTYLDIGTNDPIILNNTYFFYKAGSTGVCIEPDTNLISYIKSVRKKDKCLNIGVGTDVGLKDLYILKSSVLNTFSQDQMKLCIENGKQSVVETKKINVENINDIIKSNFIETPNFISLDTEGFDLEIIRSIDFKLYRPQVFCIETLTYSSSREGKKIIDIIKFMEDSGYKVYADTYINTIFVDK